MATAGVAYNSNSGWRVRTARMQAQTNNGTKTRLASQPAHNPHHASGMLTSK